MKRSVTLAAAAAFASAGLSAGAAQTQPPMNDLNYAYYTCDGGGAFMIEYDANPPKSATMITSNDNKRYGLQRTAVRPGVEFAGGNVKFWTDGKTVRVDGTVKTYRNCKLKAG